jgi:predicted hotdog family 3-hydroxylacyl-ACP dehydratase
MDTSSIPLTELVPHGPRMTVIDSLVSYDPKKSVAVAEIRPGSVFFENGGVPCWAGIEYMAQTIAAHAGAEARLRGERPAIGFLLGTRSYRSEVGAFPQGSRLTITVEPLWTEARIGAFDCSIEDGRVLAAAVVTVFQPDAGELARLRAKAQT